MLYWEHGNLAACIHGPPHSNRPTKRGWLEVVFKIEGFNAPLAQFGPQNINLLKQPFKTQLQIENEEVTCSGTPTKNIYTNVMVMILFYTIVVYSLTSIIQCISCQPTFLMLFYPHIMIVISVPC